MKIKIKKPTNKVLVELLIGKLSLCFTKHLPTLFEYWPWYKNWIYFNKEKDKFNKGHRWSGRFFYFCCYYGENVLNWY